MLLHQVRWGGQIHQRHIWQSFFSSQLWRHGLTPGFELMGNPGNLWTDFASDDQVGSKQSDAQDCVIPESASRWQNGTTWWPNWPHTTFPGLCKLPLCFCRVCCCPHILLLWFVAYSLLPPYILFCCSCNVAACFGFWRIGPICSFTKLGLNCLF